MVVDVERVRGPRGLARGAALPLVPVLSILLLACVFLRLMSFELRRDEELFVPPARLLGDLALYRDVFYNHTPGSAWLFRAVHAVLGGPLLMDARIAVFLGWLFFAGALAWLGRRITGSPTLAACLVVLTLANELFLSQTGMAAGNNFLPLPFSLLGLGLFVVAVSGGPVSGARIAAAGALLSLGALFKISAAVFILPVAVAALLLPREMPVARRLREVALPLLLGGLLGALPILAFLATEPRLFLAHVLGYHLGPHAALARLPGGADENAATSLGEKLALAQEIWLGGAVLLAFAACAILLVLRLRERREDAPRGPAGGEGPLVLVAATFAVTALAALLPTPSFPQYYAPPLVCLPLAAMLLVARLSPAGRASAGAVLIGMAAVALVAAAPRLVQPLAGLAHPQRMAVLRVHADGIEIARRIAAAGLSGRVATMAPIYPLEGGLDVYPEFATGPFVFRTAGVTAPDLARFYRMVGPAGVPALFDADPPAAFLLGVEPAYEGPFRDYAAAHVYREVPDFTIRGRFGEAKLLLRP